MKLCVLTDGEYVSSWAAKAIERAVSETDANVPLVVINEEARSTTHLVKKALKKPNWALYLGSERVSHHVFGEPTHAQSRHIEEIDGLASAEQIYCTPIAVEPFGNRLPQEVVEKIETNADICFRRGFGIIKGSVLSATEHGVLSFHHGDISKYRGGPPGFWEFLHGRQSVGITLQVLTEAVDGGKIVLTDSVNIEDAKTLREVQRVLYTESTGMLAEALIYLDDPAFEPSTVDNLGPLYTPPGLLDYLKFVYKNTRGVVETKLFGGT